MKKNSKFKLVPMVDLGDVLGDNSHYRLSTLWQEAGLSLLSVQSTIQLCEQKKAEIAAGESRELTDEEATTHSELENIIKCLQYAIEDFNKEKKGNDKLKLFCFFSS